MVNGSKIMLLALAVGAAVLNACGKKDSTADTSAAAASGDTTGGVGPAPAWTDENIFALLDQANAADSAHGAIASTKGTSSAVRDFGKQMMRDHHTLRAEGEALAKRLRITPVAPANDTLAASAQKAGEMLNSTAKGKDFDKAYIDHEVEMHKTVLEIATKAMNAAQSTELKNLIQKAAPNVQAHLDKAQSIQQTMK